MPALLIACFVISGATSLVFQVVWVRKLIDVFGSSSLAISTVLATFMAGLALGAWVGGRIADRIAARPAAPGGSAWARMARDPLLLYAGCEASIALCALAIPAALVEYRGANAWLWQALSGAPAALALARFGLSALVLLLPTACMGATLPLLGRRITRTGGDLAGLGRRLGTLYAANTAGAVVGAGGAGFYLIPLLGVTTTNRLAAATALALAAAIVAVLRFRPGGEPAAEADVEEAGGAGEDREVPAPAAELLPAPKAAVVAAYALSGAVAMALEVLWSRTFALVNGSSIYSFTLVLVVFLVGISLGAALAARPAARAANPVAALAWVFAGVGASVAVTCLLTDDLPSLFLTLLHDSTFEIGTVMALHALLTGLLILPAAIGLGAVMPLVMRAYVGRLDAVGRDVGRAYAANTVGAIVGSFAGGFVILPVLGLETGVRAAALVDGALAAALSFWAGRHRRALRLAAAAVALGTLLAPRWNRSNLTAGVFRAHIAEQYLAAGLIWDRDVVYYRDGIATTVSVERHGRDRFILKNNGKVEASTSLDMPTQILVGLFPVLLHGGDAQSVFVIGYGSGVTVGSIAEAPNVASVNVVELEPAVYDAADRWFGLYNHRPNRNPKVHRHIGDGRNVLLAGGRRYDVIVSEPSNPWMAGVSSLYTREFFHFARGHLAPGGIFCQWAQLYELSPRTVKMIYRTFHDSFPYVYAFTPGDDSSDTVLIGSERPLAIDLPAVRRLIRMPALAAELRRAGLERAEDLPASLLIGADEIASFAAGADLNTDDNALLEHTAPRDLIAAARGFFFSRTVHGEYWPYGHLDGIVSGLGEGPDRPREALALARSLLAHGRRREAATWVAHARDEGAPASGLAQGERLIALTRVRAVSEPELAVSAGGAPLETPDRASFLASATPEAAADVNAAVERVQAAYAHVAVGDWDDAWELLHHLPPRAATDAGRDLGLVTAYAAYKSLHMREAFALFRELWHAPGYVERRPAVLYYLARADYGLGNFRRGTELFEKLIALYPAVADEAAR